MHNTYVGYREVPFYSQKSGLLIDSGSLGPEEIAKWENSLCGLACALMILNKFSNSKYSPAELLDSAKKIDAYNDKRGWIHKKLASLLEEYGIEGTSQSVSNLSEIYELLNQHNLIIASVSPNYSETKFYLVKRKSGHLVLITGMSLGSYESYQLDLHDPGSRDADGGKNIIIDGRIFKRNFSGNIIAFKKSVNKL